jgi:TonB family protein
MSKDDFHFLLNDPADRSSRIKRKGGAFFFSLFFHFLLVLLVLFGPALNWPWKKQMEPLSERDLTRLATSPPLWSQPPEMRPRVNRTPSLPKQTIQESMPAVPPPLVSPRELNQPAPDAGTKKVEQLPQQEYQTALAEEPPSVNLPPLPENQDPFKTRSTPLRGALKGATLGEMLEKMETPGSSLQSSVDSAIRKGYFRGTAENPISSDTTGGIRKFDKRLDDFSVEEPDILNDTQGVDFSAWLRIVFYRVRDNWYAAIPELIRTGTRGKTVVIFDVQRDGKLSNIQLAKTSGISSYDRAAFSSVNLSVPFPSFPPAFTGNQLTVRFSYFYNIKR